VKEVKKHEGRSVWVGVVLREWAHARVRGEESIASGE